MTHIQFQKGPPVARAPKGAGRVETFNRQANFLGQCLLHFLAGDPALTGLLGKLFRRPECGKDNGSQFSVATGGTTWCNGDRKYILVES